MAYFIAEKIFNACSNDQIRLPPYRDSIVTTLYHKFYCLALTGVGVNQFQLKKNR